MTRRGLAVELRADCQRSECDEEKDRRGRGTRGQVPTWPSASRGNLWRRQARSRVNLVEANSEAALRSCFTLDREALARGLRFA
jgi:hypothetical protein